MQSSSRSSLPATSRGFSGAVQGPFSNSCVRIPPDADYVLLADYIVTAGSGDPSLVHTFLLESDGDWVIVDYQNSHHQDFDTIRPTSPEECCDLSALRLGRYLDS